MAVAHRHLSSLTEVGESSLPEYLDFKFRHYTTEEAWDLTAVAREELLASTSLSIQLLAVPGFFKREASTLTPPESLLTLTLTLTLCG